MPVIIQPPAAVMTIPITMVGQPGSATPRYGTPQKNQYVPKRVTVDQYGAIDFKDFVQPITLIFRINNASGQHYEFKSPRHYALQTENITGGVVDYWDYSRQFPDIELSTDNMELTIQYGNCFSVNNAPTPNNFFVPIIINKNFKQSPPSDPQIKNGSTTHKDYRQHSHKPLTLPRSCSDTDRIQP